MNDLFIVKDRIAEALAYRSMSASELADKSGLNKSTVFRYLKGDRIPRAEAVEKMATALNVDPSFLIGYNVPMIPSETSVDFAVINENQELVLLIEQLPESDKQALKGIVEALLDKSNEAKDADTQV